MNRKEYMYCTSKEMYLHVTTSYQFFFSKKVQAIYILMSLKLNCYKMSVLKQPTIQN